MRLLALFCSLGLTAATCVGLGAADDPAPPSPPLHDLQAILDASGPNDRILPPRRDVLQLKSFDGDPALGEHHPFENGLLYREIVRQALLIAAREELGLPTRDHTLREVLPGEPGEAAPSDEQPESNPAKADHGSLQIVSSIPGRIPDANSLNISLFLERQAGPEVVWEDSVPLADTDWGAVEHLVVQLEMRSRGALANQLVRLGFDRGPRVVWLEDGPVPESIQELASQWSFIPQFLAVRALHQLIQSEGESPQRLAALVRCYMRLGTLTQHHWSPAHQAFKARALLYSRRLKVRDKYSVTSRETSAYAIALSGRPRLALANELVELGKLSPEMQVIDAFCRFDPKRLESYASAPDLKPLVRYLQFLIAQPMRNQFVATAVAQQTLEELPECFGAYDVVTSRGDISAAMPGVHQAVDALGRSVIARLSEAPELPSEVKRLVASARQRNLPSGVGLDPQELQLRQQIIDALRTAGSISKDRSEPSWSVLAQLIAEEGFVQAARTAHAYAYKLGIPRSEMDDVVEQISPLLEGHPYDAGIRLYAPPSDDVRAELDAFLASLDPSAIEVNVRPMVDHLSLIDKKAWSKFITPAFQHISPVYRELVIKMEGGKAWRAAHATIHLEKIADHSPLQAVGQLRHRWMVPRIPNSVENYESRFGHDPTLLAELGRRYVEQKDWEAALRVTKKRTELEPSAPAYQALAAVYAARGDDQRWLEVLQEFLTLPEAGLSHAQVRNQIARHFMQQGEFEKALPFAETAAESWAAWALANAYMCHESLGNLEEAEYWVRAMAERYDSSAFEWYFWCRRMGAGDLPAAQAHTEHFIRSLKPPFSDGVAHRLAAFRYLSGAPKDAIAQLESLYQQEQSPKAALAAMVIADEIGDRQRRDALLRRVLDRGKKSLDDQVHGYVDFAELVHAALTAGDATQLDIAKVNQLIREAPSGEATSLNYLVGRLLWTHEQKERAEPYLRMAARSSRLRLNRTFAAALLREHGIEPDLPGHEEPRPEAIAPGAPDSPTSENGPANRRE